MLQQKIKNHNRFHSGGVKVLGKIEEDGTVPKKRGRAPKQPKTEDNYQDGDSDDSNEIDEDDIGDYNVRDGQVNEEDDPDVKFEECEDGLNDEEANADIDNLFADD